LLKKIQPLWQSFEKTTDGFPDASLDPHPELALREWEAWQVKAHQLEDIAKQLLSDHLQEVLSKLAQAFQKDLKANIYVPKKHAFFISHLSEWAAGEEADLETLKKFSLQKLRGSLKKDASPIDDTRGVWQAIEDWLLVLGEEPAIGDNLLQHAAVKVGRAYLQQKRNLASFDFSDLLQRLHVALHTPGSRLPELIRQQFPVALVDEFQDTDPWQYESLSKFYGHALPTAVESADLETSAQQDNQSSAFLMIGDPKQAIYSFRGADLQTYLKARHTAHAIWTLTENFRSSQEVVNAVNHIFQSASQPFGEVPFAPVQTPTPAKAQSLRNAQGQAIPALTVWHLNADKPLSGTQYGDEMSQVCATQMVSLLNDGVAQPGQMAVLVRDGQEAKKIRQALADRGVRSVYLSDRDSVYATREALDLACILEAVLQARNAKLLRAALTTRTLCLSLSEIEQVFNAEDDWDLWVERFNHWHLTWQKQGFLPMLYKIVHEQDIGRRMQAEGDSAERRLTNLLHLGELLQSASLSLQGESALLRFLSDQLSEPNAQGDAAQMRLETDAELVQVITFHKAKGLQYPLVFLPFVSNFKEDKDESLRMPEERLEEDIRLLYVALTRAQQAMWLGVAPRKDDFKAKAKATSKASAKSSAQSTDDASEVPRGKSALSVLLRRESAEDLALKLNAWQECTDIHVTAAPIPNALRYEGLRQSESKEGTPAKKPSRVLPRAGWTASFSALTRNLVETTAQGLNPAFERDERWLDSQIDNPVAIDNLSVDTSTLTATAATSTNATTDSTLGQAQPIYNAFPAGSAYGTLLHDIFEWQLKEGWPLLQSETDVSAETHLRWQAWWQTQANSLQLSPEHQALCLDLIRQCANTPINQLGSEQHCFGDQAWAPLSLSQLNTHNAWPEMGFTLKTHGVSSEHIDQLIRSSLHEGQSRPALQAQQLNGLLTGFMDIVLAHQGRYYVLDYKSNKLPSYDEDSLVNSMLSHRYEVQYTLYVLAVHRLLKSRVPNYDYEQHMGGALYLYLRGIDQVGQGVYFSRPSYELIHALDLAFQGQAIETLSEVQS
jgi:exodeoxyribonuclease V beta subunit